MQPKICRGRTMTFHNAFIVAVMVAATFPLLTDALTFGVIGDWAMGGWSSSWFPEIRSALQFNEQCDFLKCNFTLSVGDNVYCGNVLSCLERSFVRGFTSGGPFFPSVGNHDNVGPQIGYTKMNPRWKFPSVYYTYTMPIDETGYTVQIFAVNTMDGGLGGWLTREVAKSTARWKIIFGHYPTVGSGRHKRVGTVNPIISIMHHYNVQAYFSGHDHILEMDNVGGRVMGISGGISRGGMMHRSKGLGFRRFTMTSPGEYNKYPCDWPTHGFMTVDLSPNVMNINLFEANGGMYYDMSVTYDWIRRAASGPASMQHQWPHPSVVLESYKNESLLPPGPGGGVVFLPDGRIVPSSYRPPKVNATSPVPVNTVNSSDAPVAGSASSFVDEGELGASGTGEDGNNTETSGDGVEESNSKGTPVPSYVKYAVSSECAECNNAPVVEIPFTVFIQGISVSSLNRLFLTSSAQGCVVKDKPAILPGTDVVTPAGNLVTFTVTGVATNAYVCFSVDKGATYTSIRRSDSIFEDFDFVVQPPVGQTTAAPQPQEKSAEASLPPVSTVKSPTSSPSSQGTEGHSSVTLLVVAFLCVGGGVVGTKYAKTIFGER